MAFVRRSELWTFDVFPKVFKAGEEATVHIRPAGGRTVMQAGEAYCLAVTGLKGGNSVNMPLSAFRREIDIKCTEADTVDFSMVFPSEQEYRITVLNSERKDIAEFAVYAVEDDLAGCYPFRGDLHMHTCFSDGKHTPENVAASYRSHGYDFLAMTDHKRYYPSLRAIKSFKDIPNEMTLIPGEEVHMPDIDGFVVSPHIVNFGGEYSINALVEDLAVSEVGSARETRSIRDDCPEVMTREQFSAKMKELASQIDVPEGVDALTAATVKWVYDEIKKVNGLGIFAHPTWVTSHTFHVPDVFNDWLVENHIFDAFEVLGGENYFEHNGFQTVRYYEDRARGYHYPIVGSTDSHNCTPENRNAYICSTIVFSPENERCALIDSIKNFRSAAIDTISTEFRIVGEMRYVRYACFLLKNYFPIHDDMCFEEGRLMKTCIYGTPEEKEDALKVLEAMNGRMNKLREKYFCF